VRRAKLYYLRGRTGKRARISERATRRPGDIAAASELSAAEASAQIEPAVETPETKAPQAAAPESVGEAEKKE
jgi:large subunit ribosomal protein L19